MAMIKCPECGKKISDKAGKCPKCGCPINEKENIADEGIIFNDEKQSEDYQISNRFLRFIKKYFWLPIVCVVFIVVLVFVIIFSKNTSNKNKNNNQNSTHSLNESQISIDDNNSTEIFSTDEELENDSEIESEDDAVIDDVQYYNDGGEPSIDVSSNEISIYRSDSVKTINVNVKNLKGTLRAESSNGNIVGVKWINGRQLNLYGKKTGKATIKVFDTGSDACQYINITCIDDVVTANESNNEKETLEQTKAVENNIETTTKSPETTIEKPTEKVTEKATEPETQQKESTLTTSTSLPIENLGYFNTSMKAYTKATLENMSYTVKRSTSGKDTVEATLTCIKTYQGSNSLDNIKFTYRLYNSSGTMVKSGNILILDAPMNVACTQTLLLTYLEPDDYTIEFRSYY